MTIKKRTRRTTRIRVKRKVKPKIPLNLKIRMQLTMATSKIKGMMHKATLKKVKIRPIVPTKVTQEKMLKVTNSPAMPLRRIVRRTLLCQQVGCSLLKQPLLPLTKSQRYRVISLVITPTGSTETKSDHVKQSLDKILTLLIKIIH